MKKSNSFKDAHDMFKKIDIAMMKYCQIYHISLEELKEDKELTLSIIKKVLGF